MPDAMLVLDANDRVADLNRATEVLFDIPRAQALGRPNWNPAGCVRGSRATPGRACQLSGEVPVGDGEAQRWCHVSTTPLLDWHRLPIGRLVLFDDITDSKRAEEQLLDRERALAAVQERERMARELRGSVGQVLGYVSLHADATRKMLADGRAAEAGGLLARLAEVAREAHADVRASIRSCTTLPPRDPPSSRRCEERLRRSYETTCPRGADDVSGVGWGCTTGRPDAAVADRPGGAGECPAPRCRTTVAHRRGCRGLEARIVCGRWSRVDVAAVSRDHDGRYGQRSGRAGRAAAGRARDGLGSRAGDSTRRPRPAPPGVSAMEGPGRAEVPAESGAMPR